MLIQPHRRALEAGVFHPMTIIEDSSDYHMIINVTIKVSIKQNSIISELRVWEL
jgi:hypothetical protein